MEEDELSASLRDSIQVKTEQSKWKKISIIFIVCSILAILLLATFLALYLTKEKEKTKEEKWDWKPVGDKIQTKWG